MYNIWQQPKSYSFVHLTYIMLLHYLGKIIFSFRCFGRRFLRQFVGGSEKSRFFGGEMSMQTWRWIELLAADAWSDHHWYPRRQSSAHATSAFSSCRPL